MTLGELQERLDRAGRTSVVLRWDRVTRRYSASAKDVGGRGPMVTGAKSIDDACTKLLAELEKIGAEAADRGNRAREVIDLRATVTAADLSSPAAVVGTSTVTRKP